MSWRNWVENLLVGSFPEYAVSGSCPHGLVMVCRDVDDFGFDRVVLIADGRAPVRDLQLLPQVKYPLHVVLCRNLNNIKQYLEIVIQ